MWNIYSMVLQACTFWFEDFEDFTRAAFVAWFFNDLNKSQELILTYLNRPILSIVKAVLGFHGSTKRISYVSHTGPFFTMLKPIQCYLDLSILFTSLGLINLSFAMSSIMQEPGYTISSTSQVWISKVSKGGWMQRKDNDRRDALPTGDQTNPDQQRLSKAFLSPSAICMPFDVDSMHGVFYLVFSLRASIM